MLTTRDREIVRWVGRHGVVQAEHVMKRLSIGRTATYRRIHELVDSGLLRRHRMLYNDGGLLTATAEGLRWAGLGRLAPVRISLALIPHMIASAALAAELEPRLGDATLLSDREHRAAENATGRAIASAVLGSPREDRPHLHRPDFALLGAGDGRVIAIEVELTVKTQTRLERILRGYVRNRNVSGVRYYASPEIRDAVRRAAGAVGAERLLELAPLPPTPRQTAPSRR
jgi:DNA-binding Lrp family transcriptional regulator